MPEQYRSIRIRMFKFISWLRFIIRAAASRPYTSVLSNLLRLIRRWWQAAISRTDRLYRERDLLALSSRPTEQDTLTTSVTLAVPLLQAPLYNNGCQPGTNVQIQTLGLDEGSYAVAFNINIQSPLNSCSPSMPSTRSEPSIYTTPPVSGARAVSWHPFNPHYAQPDQAKRQRYKDVRNLFFLSALL
jgi:hypothetical protein